jgi:hypothetical protein
MRPPSDGDAPKFTDRFLEAAKAYATGTKPESGESGDHAKIQI